MLCTECSLVKDSGETVLVIPLMCRCWSCDYCRPIRKAELIQTAKRGNPNTFITLTVNPNSPGTVDDRARELSHAWRRVVRAAQRKYRYARIPFLAVFELTRAGEPHLHILCRVPWIDQRWLSAFMAEAIDAPIVYIQRIAKRAGARALANYVAKYIGKEPHRFAHSKRYWQTRDYQLTRPSSGEGSPSCWRVAYCNIQTLAASLEDRGYEIAWQPRGFEAHQCAPP